MFIQTIILIKSIKQYNPFRNISLRFSLMFFDQKIDNPLWKNHLLGIEQRPYKLKQTTFLTLLTTLGITIILSILNY